MSSTLGLSTGNTKLTQAAQMTLSPTPAAFVTTARDTSSRSPNVLPKAMATFGPRSGAINMAAMMMATLLVSRPIVATMVERTTSCV